MVAAVLATGTKRWGPGVVRVDDRKSISEPRPFIKSQGWQSRMEVALVALSGALGLVEEDDLGPQIRGAIPRCATDVSKAESDGVVAPEQPTTTLGVIEQDLERPRTRRVLSAPDRMQRWVDVLAGKPWFEARSRAERDLQVPALEMPLDVHLVTSQYRDIEILVFARLPAEVAVDRPSPGHPPRDIEGSEHSYDVVWTIGRLHANGCILAIGSR
jgi:hypothetical protein